MQIKSPLNLEKKKEIKAHNPRAIEHQFPNIKT